MVRECEVCREKRDVMEDEMRKIVECDMVKFSALDNSKTTTANLVNHKRRNTKEIR